MPSASSLERLNKTMANPRYAEDIFRLDRIYDKRTVLNRETVIVVVGSQIPAELLDRPVAQLLRDGIDQRSKGNPFRRAIVLNDQTWYTEAQVISNNPVIAVGGPEANKLSAEFGNWQPPPSSREGKYTIREDGSLIGFLRKNQAGLPQAALWGHTANGTREAVEHYIRDKKGLADFLRKSWR